MSGAPPRFSAAYLVSAGSRQTPSNSQKSPETAVLGLVLRETSSEQSPISEENGAQGRSRTTDTTIFSRLLYH